MFEAALEGLMAVIRWPAIGYLVLGVLVGIFFGAVPGLSGLVGMAILLPFTFDLDAFSAFAFLLGMFAVTTTADTISSVLLGVPGTAGSQATILDGYPLAVRGEAARAFGAAYTVSALGGVFGALVLVLSIPVVRPLVMSFGSPEFFMLGVLGITMVGVLSGHSMLKGIVAGLLGLLFSMVGYSPQGGTARYDFGTTYLLDGIPVIPLVLGLFAIPELIGLATREGSISTVATQQQKGRLGVGILDALRHWWLVLRSSAIGVYIGMLPGLGASLVDWVAYGHAVQSAKDKSQFGKGDIRGVIAPESANNAMKGGALIPTIAFGIPGSASMAILLGAFLIQGLTPGPDMLTRNLDVTFGLVWTLIIANFLAAVLLMFWTNQVAKVTFIRAHVIVPPIVLFVFMGAWMASNQMGDWYTLLLFGLLGYVMNLGGWPRAPLILGFILGTIMERSLDLSVQVFGMSWIYRPVSVVIGALALLTVAFTALGSGRLKPGSPTPGLTGKEPKEDLLISTLLTLFVAGLFFYGSIQALQWPRDVKFFPLTVGVAGSLLALWVLESDLRGLASRLCQSRWSFSSVFGASPVMANPGKLIVVLCWLLSLLPATWIIGQKIALPLFILLYLRWKGKEKWRMALSLAAIGWLFLYGVFDQVIHVNWYPSVFFS